MKPNWLHLLVVGAGVVAFVLLTHLPPWVAPVLALWTGLVHGWTEHWFAKKPFEWNDDVLQMLPVPTLYWLLAGVLHG